MDKIKNLLEGLEVFWHLVTMPVLLVGIGARILKPDLEWWGLPADMLLSCFCFFCLLCGLTPYLKMDITLKRKVLRQGLLKADKEL